MPSLSHLPSRTPTKSNLYFANLILTAINCNENCGHSLTANETAATDAPPAIRQNDLSEVHCGLPHNKMFLCATSSDIRQWQIL